MYKMDISEAIGAINALQEQANPIPIAHQMSAAGIPDSIIDRFVTSVERQAQQQRAAEHARSALGRH